jgi:hypothetical protein
VEEFAMSQLLFSIAVKGGYAIHILPLIKTPFLGKPTPINAYGGAIGGSEKTGPYFVLNNNILVKSYNSFCTYWIGSAKKFNGF